MVTDRSALNGSGTIRRKHTLRQYGKYVVRTLGGDAHDRGA